MSLKLRLSDHAHARLVERGIDLGKVKQVINSPAWQKTQRDGSIVANKKFEDGKTIEVVYKVQQREILVITFYYED